MSGDAMPMHVATGWSSLGDGLRLAVRRSTLGTTIPVALIVGTILSLVNQGSVLVSGRITWATWVRVGCNYVVPLCVSTIGFLTARRTTPGADDAAHGPPINQEAR